VAKEERLMKEKEIYETPSMEIIEFDADVKTAMSDYWSEPLD